MQQGYAHQRQHSVVLLFGVPAARCNHWSSFTYSSQHCEHDEEKFALLARHAVRALCHVSYMNLVAAGRLHIAIAPNTSTAGRALERTCATIAIRAPTPQGNQVAATSAAMRSDLRHRRFRWLQKPYRVPKDSATTTRCLLPLLCESMPQP